MIAYLDTSALVKLYIEEEGSEVLRERLKSAERLATSKVAYAEARAVFSRLRREKALNEKDYQLVKNSFQQDWNNYLVVELSDTVIALSGNLTEKYALRGFDAIHLASALFLKKQLRHKILGGCWDGRLWDAFKANMEVIPSGRPA